MKRFFPSLTVLLAVAMWAIPSVSQSPSPAASTAQPQPATATEGTPRKVWTNDDVGALRGANTVSVVGKAEGPSKTSAPSRSPYYEKDPAWYRRQLAPLQAEVTKLDSQIEKLKEFMSGKNVGEAQPFHHGPPGNPQDQMNQLEKKRQTEAAKIDELFDLARHNGIEPGALR